MTNQSLLTSLGIPDELININCKVINGYNKITKITNPNRTFNIEGLNSFNYAISRQNDSYLNKKLLYSLYTNQNIKKLFNINYGVTYDKITIPPPGREQIDCNINDDSNIATYINNSNYKLFTDLNYVAKHYPNLLISSNNPLLGLKPQNQIILEKYIIKNNSKNMNKSSLMQFAFNIKNSRNLSRVINPIFCSNLNLN